MKKNELYQIIEKELLLKDESVEIKRVKCTKKLIQSFYDNYFILEQIENIYDEEDLIKCIWQDVTSSWIFNKNEPRKEFSEKCKKSLLHEIKKTKTKRSLIIAENDEYLTLVYPARDLILSDFYVTFSKGRAREEKYNEILNIVKKQINDKRKENLYD